MPEGRTLVQQRIAYALDCVNTRKAGEGAKFAKYIGDVKDLPAAIVMNGLGQAAASLQSQDKGLLYKDLSTWLCGKCPFPPYPGSSDLLTAIKGNDQVSYLRAQYEALQMLRWLKEFADAFADGREELS